MMGTMIQEAEFTAPASAQSTGLADDQLKASQSSQPFWYVREPYPVMLADARTVPARSMTECSQGLSKVGLLRRSERHNGSRSTAPPRWRTCSLDMLIVVLHNDVLLEVANVLRGLRSALWISGSCTFLRIAWVSFRRSVVACGIGVQRVREPHHHGVCLNWHVCMTP